MKETTKKWEERYHVLLGNTEAIKRVGKDATSTYELTGLVLATILVTRIATIPFGENYGIILLSAILYGIIGFFIFTSTVHVCASKLFQGKATPLDTYRIGANAYLANILTVIPFVGWILGLLWNIIIFIKGISILHQISLGKAMTAVLIPGILLLLAVILTITGMINQLGSTVISIP